MNNPFQEQLLKAGVVSKQQVHKANKDKQKKKKQLNKKQTAPDESQIKAQLAAKEKAQRDRELNQRKEEQARNKAISAEINQLISGNRIDRSKECEIAYNFEHQKKVKRIYINEQMKQQVIQGKLGIARIEGRYELVPRAIADKIQQRNEKRVIIVINEEAVTDENDPYADFKIPDDLIW